jgi:hypothetical protein
MASRAASASAPLTPPIAVRPSNPADIRRAELGWAGPAGSGAPPCRGRAIASATSATIARAPAIRPKSTNRCGPNTTCTTPDAPAGSNQPWCHPSSISAVSRRPCNVAVQPALAFSGTERNAGLVVRTRTSRLVSPQCWTSIVPGVPLRTAFTPALRRKTPCGTNAELTARRSRFTPGWSETVSRHGRAVTVVPSSNAADDAPTVVGTVVPFSNRAGPAPHGSSILVCGLAEGTPWPSKAISPMPTGNSRRRPVDESVSIRRVASNTATWIVLVRMLLSKLITPSVGTRTRRDTAPAVINTVRGAVTGAFRTGVSRMPLNRCASSVASSIDGRRAPAFATHPVCGFPSTAAPARSRGSPESSDELSACTGLPASSKLFNSAPGRERTVKVAVNRPPPVRRNVRSSASSSSPAAAHEGSQAAAPETVRQAERAPGVTAKEISSGADSPGTSSDREGNTPGIASVASATAPTGVPRDICSTVIRIERVTPIGSRSG